MSYPLEDVRRGILSASMSLRLEPLEPRLLLSAPDPAPWDGGPADAAPGDVNRNGVVEASDYTTLKRNMGMGLFASWADGDLDSDGDVDTGDLQLLRTGFLTAKRPEPARPGPEDYISLKRNMGLGSSADWRRGDRDRDGDVDPRDLKLLCGSFAESDADALPGLPAPGDFSPAANAAGSILSTQAGNVLLVRGTSSADVLGLSQADDAITLKVDGQADQTFAGPLFGAAVYGFGGDDEITLAYSLAAELSVVVYAGGGDDAIFENSPAATSIQGQGGDDLLITIGGGADELLGGAGVDSFWFDSTDQAGDVEADELARTAVHEIAAFAQPTPGAGVSLEIAGQDIVDPATGANFADYSGRPLFADGPEYDDVIQGSLGDCYFLAGLAALARQAPAVIEQSITELGDGTCAVRFYSGDEPRYYRVDRDLPAGPACADRSPDGELWVALLEKAFAQFRFGQNSYASLEGGGRHEPFAALSPAMIRNYSSSLLSADSIAGQIADDLAAGHAVTTSSLIANPPIVELHGYMVHEARQVGGAWEITVYNPKGVDGGGADGNYADGLVTLTAEGFKERFTGFTTSLVSPSES